MPHTIELGADDFRGNDAADFCAWLNAQGHCASVTPGWVTMIDGVSNEVDEAVEASQMALFAQFLAAR